MSENDRPLMLHRPGDPEIVPKSSRPAARTGGEARMISITPGEGSGNRPAPVETS